MIYNPGKTRNKKLLLSNFYPVIDRRIQKRRRIVIYGVGHSLWSAIGCQRERLKGGEQQRTSSWWPAKEPRTQAWDTFSHEINSTEPRNDAILIFRRRHAGGFLLHFRRFTTFLRYTDHYGEINTSTLYHLVSHWRLHGSRPNAKLASKFARAVSRLHWFPITKLNKSRWASFRSSDRKKNLGRVSSKRL